MQKNNDNIKEQFNKIEDTLSDKEGEISKFVNTIKLLEEENKLLKDYNQKLADKDNKGPEGSGPTEDFLKSLKSVVDDSNKNSEAKLRGISTLLSANSTKDDFFKQGDESKKD